jgi:thiamine-monophosphate kinase
MLHSSPPAAERRFGGGGPTLADIGERALLEKLVAIAQAASAADSQAESGDDAAVWSPPADRDLAVSVDAMVENVDFRRAWLSPRRLGRRAFAVAAADIAGMGADPEHCLATLCARGEEQLEDILELQRGLCAAAAAAGCSVVGGDVSAIDGPLVIDVCVTGSLPRGRALRRMAGRPGDVLLVTGVVGRAAAGLRLLLAGVDASAPLEEEWIEAQLQPPTRLEEGRRLLEAGVRCGGDVSDGLLLDTARTARACGCAAELWAAQLPVDAGLRERFSQDWLELAAGGGEDFELLVAVAEAEVPALLQQWPIGLAPLTQVGMLQEGSGLRFLESRGGAELASPRSSASHFS